MAGKSAIFDTNYFIGIKDSGSPRKKQMVQHLVGLYAEIRCAVVLHELLRGDKFTWRKHEHQGRRQFRIGEYEATNA